MLRQPRACWRQVGAHLHTEAVILRVLVSSHLFPTLKAPHSKGCFPEEDLFPDRSLWRDHSCSQAMTSLFDTVLRKGPGR